METEPITLIGTLAVDPEAIKPNEVLLQLSAGDEELQLVICRGTVAIDALNRLLRGDRAVLSCVLKGDAWHAVAIERANSDARHAQPPAVA